MGPAQTRFRAVLARCGEKDLALYPVEFLPPDDPEARLYSAGHHGYLVGYAHLSNTRSLALLGDPDAGAYELLSPFRPPRRRPVLRYGPLNEDLGNDYIENDSYVPHNRRDSECSSARSGPAPRCDPFICHPSSDDHLRRD